MYNSKFESEDSWGLLDVEKRLDFFVLRRSIMLEQRYVDFVRFIDGALGIWTNRWGDAPLHTLAIKLFGWKTKHYSEFGYTHYYGRDVGKL